MYFGGDKETRKSENCWLFKSRQTVNNESLKSRPPKRPRSQIRHDKCEATMKS